MPYRTIGTAAAASILVLAYFAAEALAQGGVHQGGARAGRASHGSYYNSACGNYPSCDPDVGSAAWARAHDY